jgi:uncharacterized protein (TIGR03435 family)
MIAAILNHLWQSTAFAAIVFLAAWLLRHHSPRIRYGLWFAASAKFLIPFSLLVSIGNQVRFPPDTHPLHATTVTAISTYFAPAPARVFSVRPAPNLAGRRTGAVIAAVIWLGGFLALALRWALGWRRIRGAVRAATPASLECPLPALSSPSSIEPGVFGILRPVLLLPHDLAERMTPAQMDAILAHEVRHWRCHDNLTGAFHMLVEAVFWFHPLVWWIGARLTEERERDCDQAVLNQGKRARDYAHGILHVCRHYVESPLPCTSGISGADLKKRVKEIMEGRRSLPLRSAGKVLLAAMALSSFALPLAIGLLRAQALPPAPAYGYEVVSIHPASGGRTSSRIGPGPQGGLRTENTSVMQLLTFAYDVRAYQFVDAPSWISSERYDLSFTPDKTEAALADAPPAERAAFFNRTRQRMQAVLRDRFSLILRAERRTMPIYRLTVANKGSKLVSVDPDVNASLNADDGHVVGRAASIKMLTDTLSGALDRPVNDESGLTGAYNFTLQWSPDSVDTPTGPSLFTALTEQLGLRLESDKGPASVYVIEKIEKPGQN